MSLQLKNLTFQGKMEHPYEEVYLYPRRDPIVKYAVGMIVCHENKNGVITAWAYHFGEKNFVPRYSILLNNTSLKRDIAQGKRVT